MVSSDYSMGNLTEEPVSNSTFLNKFYTDDLYTFSISETSSINLNLHHISVGDDADLTLYQDSNGNGVFDKNDELLASSQSGSNLDESINYLANPGDYIAVVKRYAPGSQGHLDYELDLSATPTLPLPDQAPNLLSREVNLGNLSDEITRSGWVGNTNTSDTYEFSLGDGGVNISLSGLSSDADADMRLIEDYNGNNIIDLDEVLASSINGGSESELISGIESSGDYFLQVYQYSGDTNYQLTFDHYLV